MAMRAWPSDEQTVDDDPWGKFRGLAQARTPPTTASTIQVTLPDSIVGAKPGGPLLLGSSLDGRTYPRIITALQLLEESDDESIFCGPPSDSESTALSAEARALKVLGVAHPDDERIAREAARAVAKAEAAEAAEKRRLRKAAAATEAKATADGEGLMAARDAKPLGQADSDKRRQSAALVQLKGDVVGEGQKFICQFPVGLADDEEFCLVKRILGKNGNNMRRIAEDCNAKVRLRGIGSGFLEGADGKEANMPLQLNVSCTEFESYSDAVDRVAALLKDLYKHYRRYARSKGMEPPDVKVTLDEVRRDDLNYDLSSQKAQQPSSHRARERRTRDRERQLQQRDRDHGAADAGDPGDDNSRGDSEAGSDDSADDSKSKALPLTLPGGIPVPTTPAGRRAAARTGGALVAAMASAAAREQDRIEREKQKEKSDDRDKKRGHETDNRTPGASGHSRGNAPIGGSSAGEPKDWSWDRGWGWDRDRDWSWSEWREQDRGGGWDEEKSRGVGWDTEEEARATGSGWDKEKSRGADGWDREKEARAAGGGWDEEKSPGAGWDREKEARDPGGGWDKEKSRGAWDKEKEKSRSAGWDTEKEAAGAGAALTMVPFPPPGRQPGPRPNDTTPAKSKDKGSKGASKDKGKGFFRQR